MSELTRPPRGQAPMNDFTKRRNRRAETIMAIMVLGFWAVTATLSLAIPAAIVYALVAWARSL